jgi:hypothetical protein
MNIKTIITSSAAAFLLAVRATACDFCGCELPHISIDDRRGWYAGASEQYTDFGSLHQDGHGISDPARQYLHSSVTQLFIGYDFAHALGIQINIPMVYRSFRRAQGAGVETGDVSGVGDVSLLAHWTPLRIERGDFLFTARVLAGVKFPTGDSSRVLEEAAEGGDEEGATPSGVHGHDLALGTGSVDGIFGADLRVQWKRAFLNAGIEAAVRGSGRHDYNFADDLGWHAGIGVVGIKGDNLDVAIEARFSGDTKGEDSFRGMRATDTGSTVVYVGPKVIATWRERVSVDAGIGFPIVRENSGVASVPDLRFQAAVNIRF